MGKSGDSVERKTHHFPEWIVALSAKAAGARVFDFSLLKADPGRHTAHEAVRLAHLSEDLKRSAINEPEITRIERNIDMRDAAHQPVKNLRCYLLKPRFACPL